MMERPAAAVETQFMRVMKRSRHKVHFAALDNLFVLTAHCSFSFFKCDIGAQLWLKNKLHSSENTGLKKSCIDLTCG